MGENERQWNAAVGAVEKEKQEALINQQKHLEPCAATESRRILKFTMLDWTLKTTMAAARRCTMHITMWNNGRPCVQRT